MRIEPAIGFPDKPAIEALLAHARFISRSKQNCRALHIESERHSPFASRSAKPQFFHVRVARAGQGVNTGPSQLRSEPLKQPRQRQNLRLHILGQRLEFLVKLVGNSDDPTHTNSMPYNPYGINSMSTTETITEGSLAVLAIAFGSRVAGRLLASSPSTLKRGAGTWRGERRSRQFCPPTGGYFCGLLNVTTGNWTKKRTLRSDAGGPVRPCPKGAQGEWNTRPNASGMLEK